ncbi:MAG TPA: hypothetical protein VGH86_12860 [Phenylobacterium sp.]|jgi:hypothetical protein
MSPTKALSSVAFAAVLLATAPAVAQPVHLADGHDWTRSSAEQRRAYLAGVSNIISVGAAWDAKKTPGQEDTFSRTAQRGLKDIHVGDAVQAVDGWYAANPTQLDKPVLSVVWRELAKSKLGQAK